jgi:distribution and morphology protein 31
LLDRLPTLHRPTKEELLAAATGFWHRLQIRFKWFSIRSSRPFNFDEIFAFASWIFWGHILWVVIGTTTFFGVTIWALNTVFTQEQVASWVAGYLTRSVGVQIVFESAIVPGWSDGKIRFRNVFISRRPTNKKRRGTVSKGSSATAAAAAAAEAQIEKDKMKDVSHEAMSSEEVDDGNYTQFDLQVDTIEISLSFTKWFNGKGLLRDVEVRGVRGVLDRTHVKPTGVVQDPTKNRREHKTGDFEIDSFKLDDVLLTMYQPGGFRPYTISVFNGELPRLRKQWLFYDILNANNISGSFDDSLFTIHPRQVHGYTGAPLLEGRDPDAGQWKKHSRLRVDGLKIDHLNRGVEGPFSWIYEGNIDIVADYMIPNDADDSVAKVITDIYERLETTVNNPHPREHAIIAQNVIHNTDDAYDQERAVPETLTEDDKRPVVIDLKLHLNDVRASIPIFNNTLSYVNNAAVRPIIAYINSHSHGGSNFIPISCRVVKRLSDFDGSWTVFDCGLVNNVSREVYRAFVSDIGDRKHRNRRLRKVTLWAASVAAQALFIGLAGQLA